jgi:hypothetical protein
MLVLLSNEFPNPFWMISKQIVLSLLLLAVLTAMSIMQQPLYVIAENEKSEGAKDNGNGNNDSDEEEQEEEATEEESTETETETEAAADNDPTPGVGNNDNELGQDNPQPDRVGSHDDQTSGEGANNGGTVTDPTLCDITTVEGCSTTVDSNCFGKVISERAQDHKENPEEGTLGSHSRDPVPELEGNETPRQGIGNQNQGHPAAHGAFNSQFEDEDEQNVIDNC